MPTNRKRIARTRRTAGLRPEYWALLNDAPLPEGPASRWLAFFFEYDMRGVAYPKGVARTLWATHREQVLAGWVARHPGTRPSCWWRFDAPHVFDVDPLPQESQAAFLKRCGLLAPEEARRLTANDFESQPLPRKWWPIEEQSHGAKT